MTATRTRSALRWLSALAVSLSLCAYGGAAARAQDDFGLGDEDEGDAAGVLAEDRAEDADTLRGDGSDEAVGDEAADDEAADDEAVDDEAVDDEAVDLELDVGGELGLDAAGAGSPAGSGRAVRLRTAAGLGFGTLAYERPIRGGVEVLSESPFGAAELLLGAHLSPASTLSFDLQLAYQSSIGLALELQPLFGLPERVRARYQRGELSLAPVLRLGASPRSVAIALPIGFGLQLFEPTVHQYTVERFSLGGPQLRVELRLPIGDIVSVRLGPEAQWILVINPSLADAGACCQGFAVAAQGAIEAKVGEHFLASLAYRQAHGFAPAGAWRFKSVERFLTARLAGEL